MAKLKDAAPGSVKRSTTLAFRRRFVIRESDGVMIVQKWPRRRGPTRSPRQQAWIDRFKCLAQALKAPEPFTLDAANFWADSIDVPSARPLKGSGWFYRDVLVRASFGKLIVFNGEKQILTPTVKATRMTTQAVAANTETVLPLTNIEWDTNRFWSSSLNPSRLTVRSPGLYLIGATTEKSTGGTSRGYVVARRNGTETSALAMIPPTSQPAWGNILGIVYCHADDWFDLRAYLLTGASTWKVLDFWMMAISPETLIP